MNTAQRVTLIVMIVLIGGVAGFAGVSLFGTSSPYPSRAISEPTSLAPQIAPVPVPVSPSDVERASAELLPLSALPIGTVTIVNPPPDDSGTCNGPQPASPIDVQAQYRLPTNEVLFEDISADPSGTVDSMLQAVHAEFDCGSIPDGSGGTLTIDPLLVPNVDKRQIAYQVVGQCSLLQGCTDAFTDVLIFPFGKHALIDVALVAEDQQPDPTALSSFGKLALEHARS